MQLPGISDLIDKENIPESLLLLTGPVGAGKSLYCRQFFADGLLEGDYCIYVSSSLTNKQFRTQLPRIEKLTLIQNSKFINPFLLLNIKENEHQEEEKQQHQQYSSASPSYSFSLSDNTSNIGNASGAQSSNGIGNRLNNSSIKNNNNNKLSMTLREIHSSLSKIRKRDNDNDNDNIDNPDSISVPSTNSTTASSYSSFSSLGNRSIRIVVDSLTQLVAVFGENAVLKFVNDLSFLLKEAEAMAIFTLTTPFANQYLTNALSSILDGVIEMRLEDTRGSLLRSIRLLSIKGLQHSPSWINFKISDDGSITFADQSSTLTCTLCGKAVLGTPILDSEFTFDSKTCLETYKKLAGVYGSNISEVGLPSEVVNVSFFYIDIVSLSDPSLSVKKQMEKIVILNKMVGSCDAFFRTKEKKIILSTGDGMAIGFLSNPELPFQLSTQLHRRLRIYNRNKSQEDAIGVRIGLSSGPVFVVNDINNNQNVWGPGIVLARRVMDIGDNLHILLTGGLAEELIALKEEYRATIKPIVDYRIKHGQTIRLYSAFSKDFGNPKPPAKVIQEYY